MVYGLVIGGVDRKAYIQMMEKEAQEAAEMKRLRIIVQDNSPIHRCQEVKQLWSKWEGQGLYIATAKAVKPLCSAQLPWHP